MTLRHLFAFLLLPAAAFAAAAVSNIEFNGVLVDATGQTQVSLLNPVTGEAKWVFVGKKFGAFTVAACNINDLKDGKPVQIPIVTLTREGSSLPLLIPIKSSTIVASPTAGTLQTAQTTGGGVIISNGVQPGGNTVTFPNGPGGLGLNPAAASGLARPAPAPNVDVQAQ